MGKYVEWRGKTYQMPSKAEWDILSGFHANEWINYGVVTRIPDDKKTSLPGWDGWGDDDTAAMSVNMDTANLALLDVIFGEVLPGYMGEWFDIYDANVYPIEVLDALIARLREMVEAFDTADWDKIPTYLYQYEEEGKIRREPVMGLEHDGWFGGDASPEEIPSVIGLSSDENFMREWETASEEEQRAFIAATSGIARKLYGTFLEKLAAIRKAHPEAWYFVIYGV